MNTLKLKLLVYPLVTLASITASGLALADDPTPDNLVTTAVTSTRTRADAVAEYYHARATNGMRFWGSGYNALREAKSVRSRDDVKAEMALLAPVNPLVGEDSGSFALARQPVRQQPAQQRLLATAPQR